MPYEKNKTAYQDEELFEREQRNVLDVRNWNRDLMGQTFYQICHNNKNKYRTIQFKWNPFVESLKPMISNPIDSAPPEGMKPIPAGALQRAAQMTNMSMFNSPQTQQKSPSTSVKPIDISEISLSYCVFKNPPRT